MKKWLPLLWIALAALVIAAGAFLPGWILTNAEEPELNLDYQIVSVSAQDSTDYYWRLLCFAEYSSPFTLQDSVSAASASNYYTDEETDEIIAECMDEAETLSEAGVLPGSLMTSVRVGDKTLSTEYIFDAETMRGFRIGYIYASDDARDIYTLLTVDLSSGKIISIRVAGVSKRQIANAYADFGSWAGLLRAYADYLGLETETDLDLTESGDENDVNFFSENLLQTLTYAVPSENDTVTLYVVESEDLFYIFP